MQPFMPGQCLFCPKFLPDFTDSVMHMQKSHGLFIPSQPQLVVDLETLFKYLHLVVFGYRECLHCGTVRATVQAAQQHMTSKGHCKFDISEQDSEFTEFYDFFELKDDMKTAGTKGNNNKETREQLSASPSQKPLLVDKDSLLLPSGRIALKQDSVQQGPSFSRFCRRTRVQSSKLRPSPVNLNIAEGPIKVDVDTDTGNTQHLSKRDTLDKSETVYPQSNMRARDRNSLMHLSPSQQQSLIRTQQKHEEKVQRKEERKQRKIDTKGNKNLYAYWATETPVYQCG
ncbi:hypothetical protein LX32DRAFT_660796 [Colletotrichum zoysiae]|uniref:ZN622/Rei1/Reh1 zinc finger C2H2-type domain-containing protein n=1 Tax=Colletotrichum zoysiae TaxID=1216348 RepID=A0AAD9HQ43_9PEZI|nr:hypothetical protein LX32DRAFT_660796 [Colletotrichum zoysiae]